ncbi:MAG TPA: CAP domain-containing protein [Sphingomicrobium sp.]
MKMHIIVAASAALTTASAAPAQRYAQGTAGQVAQRILAAHNIERARVGAAPLQWDANLAAHAASYGPVLARMRALVHSPRASRPGERENLAMGWHGTMSAEQLVGMWSQERRLLAPGSSIFPARSRTGRWEDIAHYTQMVWPTTTRVGCAVYPADYDYLICRYSPPGNIDGKPIFVAAAASAVVR